MFKLQYNPNNFTSENVQILLLNCPNITRKRCLIRPFHERQKICLNETGQSKVAKLVGGQVDG
jgi:hypothetical protein